MKPLDITTTSRASLLLAGLLCASGSAHAALFDRGNGMIYDNVLDVTWLQDLNYAKTSGYGPQSTSYYQICFTPACTAWDGQFWQQGQDASNWAASLNVGGVSGWRLPSGNLIGNNTPSTNGSTDVGTNNVRSELGHLFYVDLGNSAGAGTKNFTFLDAATGTTKSFINPRPNYWLEESASGTGWYFGLGNGAQDNSSPIANITFYATAVHDGDIAVPVPAAAWLFGSGALGLAGLARRQRKAASAA